MPVKRHVHGDDLLYRFFKDLFARDADQASALSQSILEATAIWFPQELYFDWPVMLPFVVRDPKCRGPVELELGRLNWFEPTDRFRTTRATRLASVIAAFEALERGDLPAGKVVSTRYTEGLPKVPPEARVRMLDFLRRFTTTN